MDDEQYRLLQNKRYSENRWRRLRKEIVEDNMFICQSCKRMYKSNELIVHHIEEVNKDNILDDHFFFNKDNLTLECQKCHNSRHHGKKLNYLEFDEKGRVIIKKERVI